MILIIAESKEGKFKKNAFEIATFGSRIAQETGRECAAVVLGSHENPSVLGNYGVPRVYHVNNDKLDNFDDVAYRDVVTKLAGELNAELVVLPHTAEGKGLTGKLSVAMDAGCISAVNGFKVVAGELNFVRPVFSGKAFATYKAGEGKLVVSLIPNSLQIGEATGDEAEVINKEIDFRSSGIELVEKNVVTGEVPLPEAELVVSAGRGMKEPSNWGIIEELADKLGATTACSRPVSDSGWRPHHEHVGQTGIAIRPNLYIAIGISGAIQHLAGVNNSKVIVVINKDPEAPFFKAADYGVCADLFDVVPRLTEAIEKFKAENN